MGDQTIADVEASLAQFVAEDVVLLDRNVPILKREITALLASHRRMKEALERIKTGDGMFQPVGAGDGNTYVVSEVTFMRRAQEIARQALQGDALADR